MHNNNVFFPNSNEQEGESMAERERLSGDVYYVHSDQDDTVLIGMDIELIHDDSGTLVHWLDTVKERRMMAEKTEMRDDGLSFTRVESEGGGTYNFIPMSLDAYNNHVKDRLKDGGSFDNVGALNTAFLSAKELID